MSDWTDGYVADIGYTYGVYAELNPLRVKLAFINAGLAFPRTGNACELGFGQGVSTNVHAAATTIDWCGTDFNPSQAAFAQELSTASGANVKLFDQSFEEFCNRADLPDFDFIGLHGIWSWISDENRHVIVDFVRRKLKVGGVLYISYNTQPGWAAMVPIRELMAEHYSTVGSQGKGVVGRIDESLQFVEKLLETNPKFSAQNAEIKPRMDKLKSMNRNYLAHEYFNRDWVPMAFAKMADWLQPAKLSYACSAHYLEHINSVNITPQQNELLNEIVDPMFRQTVYDLMVNQTFRRDYWVRGARKLNKTAQLEELKKTSVILASAPSKVSYKATAHLGQVNLNENVYRPIVEFLADFKVKTLGEVATAMEQRGIPFGQVVQAAFILAGSSQILNVQDTATIEAATPQCQRLNKHLCKLAATSGEIQFLASPVSGSGVFVTRFQQLFLLALSEGMKNPSDWANYVHSVLIGQNERILQNGVRVTEDQQINELDTQAQQFAIEVLPVLAALKVVI